MQPGKIFRMVPQSCGLLRVGVLVCFKLLMGVPWHAFPPEALLVRRIIEDLLPQVSEKPADSVNSVEGVSSRTPIDPTATVGTRSSHQRGDHSGLVEGVLKQLIFVA